jgi:hypothetical protein
MTKRARIDSQRRRLARRLIISRAANATASVPLPHRRSLGRISIADVAAVVFTVRVVVAFPPAAMVAVDGFKAQLGGLCAFAGEVVRVQLRFSVPE